MTSDLKTLLRFAAPGIAVFITHGIAGEIFGHEPYVDPVVHFAGGVVAAFFFFHLSRAEPGMVGPLTRLGAYLMAAGLTCVVALFWEFGEYLSDVYLATRAHTSIGSTLRDLLNGILGALAFIAGHSVFRSR